MTYETPALPYAYNALEPHIDEQTMKIHHDKHHVAYTAKFNAAIKGTALTGKNPEELIANPSALPKNIRQAIIDNGGGHVNHAFFWEVLGKEIPAEGEVIEAIKETFGSMETFKDEFSKAAATQFGSGWAWLVINEGKLEVISTANQDSPLALGKTPLLALDVWEHAYYLKYQNKRPDYIEAFFNVINWKKVNEHYLANK